jgi:hypothetical protein
MSTRKSPPAVNPEPSNLRNDQGRIPASGSEGLRFGLMLVMEDFKPASLVVAHELACQSLIS